ncbi:hypothetical protein [Cupriavidus necator]
MSDVCASPTTVGTNLGASEELRAAVLAEALGELVAAQRSQQDLLALQRDLDVRLTAAITALRTEVKRAEALRGLRDAIWGELALRAAQQARQEFIEAVKDFRVTHEPIVPSRSSMPLAIAIGVSSSLLTLLVCLPFLLRH